MAQSGKNNSLNMMRKRAEFLGARNGVRATGFALRIEAISARPNNNAARVGITVTKKNGNSVVRSRIKRRIRHALYAQSTGDMRPGHDYVFISKPNALITPFDTLCSDISALIDKSHKRLDSLPTIHK